MSLSLPHPDPMPVREVLRVLRHGLRRGRRGLRETVPVEALPEPAAFVAATVLRGLDALAGEVDQATTRLARRLLSDGAPPVPRLPDFGTGPASEAAFAVAMYAALRAVLRRLGDGQAYVSEALARQAYGRAAAARPGWWRMRPAEAAADMALRLLDAAVVRDVSPEVEARLGRSGAAVAVFAALLWLMSERSDEDAGEALAAATDLAAALAAEVASAAATADRAQLAALFARFAPHV